MSFNKDVQERITEKVAFLPMPAMLGAGGGAALGLIGKGKDESLGSSVMRNAAGGGLLGYGVSHPAVKEYLGKALSSAGSTAGKGMLGGALGTVGKGLGVAGIMAGLGLGGRKLMQSGVLKSTPAMRDSLSMLKGKGQAIASRFFPEYGTAVRAGQAAGLAKTVQSPALDNLSKMQTKVKALRSAPKAAPVAQAAPQAAAPSPGIPAAGAPAPKQTPIPIGRNEIRTNLQAARSGVDLNRPPGPAVGSKTYSQINQQRPMVNTQGVRARASNAWDSFKKKLQYPVF